jgi:multidrug efflux pump
MRLPRLPDRSPSRSLADDRHHHRMFVASLIAMPLIPRQFFPSSDRPELLVDITLPQNASIYASEAAPSASTRCSRTIPTSSAGAPMSAAARSASTCRSTCSCPTTSSARRSSWRRTWRRATAAGEARGAAAERIPRAVARVYPLELGPPVGWPVQYRVSGPDISEVREIALKLAAVMSANPHTTCQLRLDGAGAAAAHPDRPGRGAPPRRQLAGGGAGPATRSCRACR